jgi:hypothetical protein
MNIIHASKVGSILQANYEVIFAFHSEETLDALIAALHNNGIKWADDKVMTRENYDPLNHSLPRAIRIDNGRASTGSIETYRDNWRHLKQYRVVL